MFLGGFFLSIFLVANFLEITVKLIFAKRQNMHVQEALKIRHTFVHRQHCDFDVAENMYALTNRFLII